MRDIVFYFDFISPYAYLAFEHQPRALEGLSYSVIYKPVLFAGMLKHGGQLGPAEIPSKRAWTYRQVQWLGQQLDIELTLPRAHPFNPLALLRLALACGRDGSCNRFVAESIFRHVWRGGLEASDSARQEALVRELQPARDSADPQVKAELLANTQEALELGAFGVPSWWVDERMYWGLDALPMLREAVAGQARLSGAQWREAADLPVGVARPREPVSR